MMKDEMAEQTPAPNTDRREFMRFVGTFVLGVTVMEDSSRAESRPNDAAPGESTFNETARIHLNVANPSAFHADADGRILVAGENTILLLNSNGEERARHSINGLVHSMAKGPGNKFVLAFRSHLAIFDPQNASMEDWPSLGERSYLTAVAADERFIYAADAGNRVVLRYSQSRALLNRIGERDSERDVPGLVVPSPYFDLALDPSGALWVVNPGKHGLESYRPDGSPITSWYRPGADLSGFCGCCNPTHIAFRSDSSLVTLEKGLNRIKVTGPDLNIRGLVAGPRSGIGLRVDLGCAEKPAFRGLAVDSKDRILVLDAQASCIRVYEEVVPAVQT